MSELDQASSGFEDCSSLIRPKASVDSTHTTAAPSLAESMRTHKPQSIPDSLQTNSKPPSVTDNVKTYKAPSISSAGSNKSSGMLQLVELELMLTLLHSERPKLYGVLTILSAVGLRELETEFMQLELLCQRQL